MSNPSAAPALDLPEPEAVSGPQLPTLTDLDAATAAVLADPQATRDERQQVLEAEEALFLAYERRPEAEAVLEAGI
jgi:hypothetical protein